jgi:hypothetical protein
MDLQMPVVSGTEALRIIRSEFPSARIIVLTTIAVTILFNGGAAYLKFFKTLRWAGLLPWFAVKPGTPREQMYIDAVRSMYEGYDHISGQERWERYLQEMNSIRKQFPDDLNGSMFYALGLGWTAGSAPEGFVEQRRKALDILLPIFATHPNNPGAAHYIIHAADTPELAAAALPAARKYASIAPDSPHALHMPSHIFGEDANMTF